MSAVKFVAISACILFGNAAVSHALPTLQLDIPGGTYNTSDETTYSTSSHFDLVALLCGNLDPTRTYYISAALEPKLALSTPPPNIGSFTMGGVTYSPANMYWGKPPANVLDTVPGNLATHDEFPTYYAEFAFKFDAANTTPAYNTQTGDTASGTLYTYSLSVDTSPLLPGYSVHFDLYDEAVQRRTGNYTLDDFAPFSHDAQSTTNSVHVPDSGSTCVLMGLGVFGLIVVARTRRWKAS
jgi:hypothetical protein